jgi:hypothetical protein
MENIFTTFKGSCIQVLVDLSSADSVTKLDARKVNAYFKSKGSDTEPRDDFIVKIRPLFKFIPSILGDEVAMTMLSDGNWMNYRLSYSSSADLILKAIEIVGGRLPSYMSPAEIQMATNSSLKKHDKTLNDRLPNILIAKAYVILEAAGILPENWYQGKRAINAIPVRNLKSLRSIAASLHKICLTEGSAENIDNLEDLNYYAISSGVTVTAGVIAVNEATEFISDIVDLPKAFRDRKDIIYWVRTIYQFLSDNIITILLLFVVIFIIYI